MTYPPTTRLGLIKPERDDLVNVEDLNGNFDVLDLTAGAFATTSSDVSAGLYVGQLKFETNTGVVYIWTGSAWTALLAQTQVAMPAPVEDVTTTSQNILRTNSEFPLPPNTSYNWAPLPTDPVSLNITLSQTTWCDVSFFAHFTDASTAAGGTQVLFAPRMTGATVLTPGTNKATLVKSIDKIIIRDAGTTKSGQGSGFQSFKAQLFPGTTTVDLLATIVNSSSLGVIVACDHARLQVTPLHL
jgi:hypothetical protein